MKFIFKFIFVVIALFMTLIIEEAIRLRVEPNARPIIILDRTKYCLDCIMPGETLDMEYQGIGYSVSMTYHSSLKSTSDNKIVKVEKKEFKLFYKFKLWSWQEAIEDEN